MNAAENFVKGRLIAVNGDEKSWKSNIPRLLIVGSNLGYLLSGTTLQVISSGYISPSFTLLGFFELQASSPELAAVCAVLFLEFARQVDLIRLKTRKSAKI